MGKATPEKTDRNKKLVELKGKHTFEKLAKIFHITPTRAKQIYYKYKDEYGVEGAVHK